MKFAAEAGGKEAAKRVVITGITGTLGDALGMAYRDRDRDRDRGWEVIGVSHRSSAQSTACDRLVHCKQQSAEDAERLLDLDPDILILNAGGIETELGSDGLPQAAATEAIYRINAVFPSLVAIAAGERGCKRRLDLVAIGSIADGSPSCFGPVYHASKVALHHFYAGVGPIAQARAPELRVRLYRPGVIRGPLSWAPVLRLNERGRAIRAKRCEGAPEPEFVALEVLRWIDGDARVGGDSEPFSFRALKLLFALAPDLYARMQYWAWRRGSRFEGVAASSRTATELDREAWRDGKVTT